MAKPIPRIGSRRNGRIGSRKSARRQVTLPLFTFHDRLAKLRKNKT